jgi:hypothetical protein
MSNFRIRHEPATWDENKWQRDKTLEAEELINLAGIGDDEIDNTERNNSIGKR